MRRSPRAPEMAIDRHLSTLSCHLRSAPREESSARQTYFDCGIVCSVIPALWAALAAAIRFETPSLRMMFET